MNKTKYIINDISLPVDSSPVDAYEAAKSRLQRAGIKMNGVELSLYRKSVDARKKKDIRLVYSVLASGISSSVSDALARQLHISPLKEEELFFRFGNNTLSASPVIVGTGPCGLFAALLLARNGYAPIVLERGGNVDERVEAVERFHRSQILDPDSNVQFGAGGAGTFSDGKLVTRLNDPHASFILSTLVKMGADPDILIKAKPHIGTDVLRNVTKNMIAEIEALGGKILFHTRFLRPIVASGSVKAVETTAGRMEAGALILAIGHSARDTYEALLMQGLAIEAKPFSVGMRIEHRAESIDRAMYGELAGHPALGHAEYNLSHNTKVRGVYTFCMCPGGTVVAAASEQGGVVVNGMSERARNGENSNSAVVCSVFKEDYGSTPMRAIAFQRSIEKAAFVSGGYSYAAPFCTVGSFLNAGEYKRFSSSVSPTYMNGEHLQYASPENYLPNFVCKGIRDALLAFDQRIEGFASPDALLTGAETRTSAPIRILRDRETYLAIGYDNLYPGGEGAGYAGGITSAALDGMYIAVRFMERFAPML